MAAAKYFHLRHKTAGTDFLVRAPKPALALVALCGDPNAAKPATDDDISAHFDAGLKVHEKSRPVGEGKLFLVVNAGGNELIRAKNPADAFSLLNDDAYSVEVAGGDVLVRLLEAGLKPVHYVEPTKPSKGTKGAANEGESTSDAGTGTGTANADAGDGAGEEGADASSESVPAVA